MKRLLASIVLFVSISCLKANAQSLTVGGGGVIFTSNGNVEYSASASTQTAILQLNSLPASTTGLMLNGAASGTADLMSAQSNGTVVLAVSGSASTGARQAILSVLPANASSTGTVITLAASQTADALRVVDSNGIVKARLGAQGMIIASTHTIIGVNTLVPDFQGALIQVTNFAGLGTAAQGGFMPAGTFVLCTATGTAVAQFAVVGSTHGVNANGCGSNQ